MNNIIAHKAEQYRQKAEEVRTTADYTRDLVCREALRRLAEGYEHLAENLERVASRTDVDETGKLTGS